MKKIVALSVSLIMCAALVLTGCSSSDSSSSSTATEAAAEEAAPAEAEAAESEREPITITFWGKFGSGVNGDATRYLVDKFNEENEYGITVNYESFASTGDIMAEVITAVAAGQAPELIMMDNSTVPVLYENGVLADVSEYADRDNFDRDNIIKNMQLYCIHDDKLISIPFARSNIVYIYNTDIFDECGVEAPETIDDLVELGKTIYAQKNMPAFCLLFDASFYQEALLVGMGSEGNISKDGMRPAALEDGTFEKLLTDWQGWIAEGWCVPPDVTNAEDTMKENFYQGKLASMVISTGAVKGVYEACADTGVNFEVAYFPGYNGYQSGSGGSQIAAVAPDKTDEQIEAAWEFMKFMMEDENVAYFSTHSGYLPGTNSVLTSQEMLDFWEEYPGFKVSIDQMEYASEPYWSVYRNDWNAEVKIAMSAAIQDNANVADEIAYLESQKDNVFKD